MSDEQRDETWTFEPASTLDYREQIIPLGPWHARLTTEGATIVRGPAPESEEESDG